MKLTEIVTKDVPVLNKNRPLLDALEILNKEKFESVCVSDNGKMVGAISYRDILFRIGGQRLRTVAPESLYISGFMKEFTGVTSDDTSIRKVAKLMLELPCDSLPMFYGETFLGVIYKRSLLKLVQDRENSVSSMMRKNFPIVKSHDRVIHARKLFIESGVSMIPVLNEDGLILGTLSQGDVLNTLIEFQKYVPEKHQKSRIRQLSISTTMKLSAPAIESDLTLGDACQLILKRELPGLVITQSSKLAGIMTPDEVLEFIVGTFPEE